MGGDRGAPGLWLEDERLSRWCVHRRYRPARGAGLETWLSVLGVAAVVGAVAAACGCFHPRPGVAQGSLSAPPPRRVTLGVQHAQGMSYTRGALRVTRTGHAVADGVSRSGCPLLSGCRSRQRCRARCWGCRGAPALGLCSGVLGRVLLRTARCQQCVALGGGCCTPGCVTGCVRGPGCVRRVRVPCAAPGRGLSPAVAALRGAFPGFPDGRAGVLALPGPRLWEQRCTDSGLRSGEKLRLGSPCPFVPPLPSPRSPQLWAFLLKTRNNLK